MPVVVLAWIERDLDGMDDASIAAVLTPDYAARATRLAIAEMVRVGVPAGLGARPTEGDKRGRFFTSESGADNRTP